MLIVHSKMGGEGGKYEWKKSKKWMKTLMEKRSKIGRNCGYRKEREKLRNMWMKNRRY